MDYPYEAITVNTVIAKLDLRAAEKNTVKESHTYMQVCETWSNTVNDDRLTTLECNIKSQYDITNSATIRAYRKQNVCQTIFCEAPII